MNGSVKKVLVVGATGGLGRVVVDQAVEEGYAVRAFVRDLSKAGSFPETVKVFVGDVTQPDTLKSALDGLDAVILAHGSDGSSRAVSEAIDYGGVRNVLLALEGVPVRIVLNTAIGITNRETEFNRHSGLTDWKHRSERLLRASGLPYTIVRPGWFDDAPANHPRILMLQGDTRRSGTINDGLIARRQLARVLVESVSSSSAVGKTFELIAEAGDATSDLEPLFADLTPDIKGQLDAPLDVTDMPLDQEPPSVRQDLQRVQRQ
ncbi:SDR family oxidoreductase [Rhizobium leguminosarum]|uniref:SDR family oxidoreductase n=1 Tax=Rhizobium leguminosarum TaxID=384 RepID=UPI00103D31F2|nr:SDR family oxidoreductase [Rhizobium leguminosarum]TBY85078.1 SDR family oxidoreductase [Rhizobium leguminosarum bv. viciae]TBZ26648.1 SDR family oxidoreductase [Rhizobium leguminosarum bv. viciae]